jgi:hypothetical protein
VLQRIRDTLWRWYGSHIIFAAVCLMTVSSEISSTLAKAWNAVRSAARIGRSRNIVRLLQQSPQPLIVPDARLIVVFSPKSACTSVVIWTLHHLGKMQEARAYNDWPHRYRTDVYYHSPQYREAVRRDLTGFRVLRVVRDPFDRAVSSFRHAQRFGLADNEFAELLGRKNVAEAGVSFRDFLDLLERLDLRTCNEHFRLQRHPVEAVLPVTHLINISTDDLFTRLNQVESDLGLRVTDFAQLDWIHALDTRRNRFGAVLDAADAYAQPFTQWQARRGPWPRYEALLTPAACERVARLYAVDIAAYGASGARPALAKRPQVAAAVTARTERDKARAERRAARRQRRAAEPQA